MSAQCLMLSRVCITCTTIVASPVIIKFVIKLNLNPMLPLHLIVAPSLELAAIRAKLVALLIERVLLTALVQV